MSAPGVSLIQRMPYRGNPNEEWSNQYHFVGSAPSTDADWKSLVDDLAALVAPFLLSDVTIIRAYCYDNLDGSHDSVLTYDMLADGTSVAGALAAGIEDIAPGDAAMWARWKTARTNTNGKPIYLRKYYHGVAQAGSTPTLCDTLDNGQRTALAAGAAALNASSGDWPGIAGPDGVAPGLSAVSTYITTRTLKRRGRRPH